MTLRRPNLNFLRVQLNQSFPDKMKIQFIARIVEFKEDGSNLIMKLTDDQGTLDLEINNYKFNINPSKNLIVHIFAEVNGEDLFVEHIKVLDNFDYETYNDLHSSKSY